MKYLLITALLASASVQATNEGPDWEPFDFPIVAFKECYEYRLEKATTTWDRDTFSWSELTDWPGAGPLDWGVVPNNTQGHHSGNNPRHTEDGDRDFIYLIVDERLLETEECKPPIKPPQPVNTLGTGGLLTLILLMGGLAYWRTVKG